MQEHTIRLEEIENLLKENPNLEIETPDGWVKVNKFFNQGVKQTYKVTFKNGLEVVSTLDHKYQTNLGMIPLEEIREQHNVLTKKGYTQIKSIVKDRSQNTYDIEVNHLNHRFYADGVAVSNCADGVNTYKLFETIVLEEESEEFNPYLYNGHILSLDHKALWHSISMFKHNLPLNDLEGLRENVMTIINRLLVLEDKYKRIKGTDKYAIGSSDDVNFLLGSKVLNELLMDSIGETLHIEMLRPQVLKKLPKVQNFLDYISADFGLIGKIESNKSRGEFMKFETRKTGWGRSAKGVPVLDYFKKNIHNEYWSKMLKQRFRDEVYTLVDTIDNYRGLVLELQRLGKMYRYAVADDRGYAVASIELQFNGTDTRRFSNSSGTGDDRLVLSGQKLDLLSYYGGNGLAGLNAQGLPSTVYSYIKKSENDVGEVKRIIRIKDKQFNNWFRRKKKILKELLNFNLKTKFSQKK